MKTINYILGLSLLILITACTSAPSSPETTISLPTPIISAEDLVETQCPLNNQLSADAASRLPRVYSKGMCGLHFAPGLDTSLIGVFIGYPAGWTIRPVSEDGTIIILELEPRIIYLQAFQNNLALEQADQVTYSVEAGEAEPVILPEEVTKDKSIQEIGDKQVMVLTTTFSEQTIARYFLTRSASGKSNTLYMFQFTVLAPDLDNSQLVGFVETLISTMAFDQ